MTTANAAQQLTPDAEGLYTMEAAKKLGTPGMRFRAPTGSIGTVLPDRSSKGKLRAELTCTAGGQPHIREVSDWHQCGVSPDMKKKAKRKTAKSVATDATVATPNVEEVRAQLEAKLAEARASAGLPATVSPELVEATEVDGDDGDEFAAEAAAS